MHKRTCPKSNSNQIKDLIILVQSLTDTNQSLQLEIESLKLTIQNLGEQDIRTQTFVSICIFFCVDFET